jgi:purine catabolism regulator
MASVMMESSYNRIVPPRSASRFDWLDNWLSTNSPEATVLEQHGLRTDHFYATVLYKSSVPLGDGHLVALLQSEVVRRRLTAPVFGYRDLAVLFLPIEDPQQTQRLKRLSEELRERLGARLTSGVVYCGVGRPACGLEVRRSFRDAQDALGFCTELRNDSHATFFGDSSLFQLFHALGDSDKLRHFCQNWLAALIDYDVQQRSDLLETLRVYFDNNGNTARTAAQLTIHRNTLAYRLNRIAEITQLDLEDADVRLNLQLALKARKMLGNNSVAATV